MACRSISFWNSSLDGAARYWSTRSRATDGSISIDVFAVERQYRRPRDLDSTQSLDEVQRLLSRRRRRPVVRKDALVKGPRYDAAVRLRLDVAQLSQPFQINALASLDWSLQSEWDRWSFVP